MSFYKDGDTSPRLKSLPSRFNAVVARSLPSVDSQPCHQFACRMVIHRRARPACALSHIGDARTTNVFGTGFVDS